MERRFWSLPQSSIEEGTEREKVKVGGRMLKWRKHPIKEGVSKQELMRVEEKGGEGAWGAFHPFSALKTELTAPPAHSWAGGGERWEGAPLDSAIALSVFTFSACLCLSFQVITPFRRLILCAENRKEMEDWISSLKSVQSREHYEVRDIHLTNTRTRACNDLCTSVCPWTGAEMKDRQRETGNFLRKCSSNNGSEIRSVLWLWDAAFRINILLSNKYCCTHFSRSLDIKVRSFKELTVTYKLYDHRKEGIWSSVIPHRLLAE